MSSSWLAWPRGMCSNKDREESAKELQREEEILHRKRLAAILRYIASMHQALRSVDTSSSHSFVRYIRDASKASDFFQYERTEDDIVQEGDSTGGVLFSTNDFRRLIVAEAMDGESSSLWSSPPFSFYASSLSSSSAAIPSAATHSLPGNKRRFAGLYGGGTSTSKSHVSGLSQESCQYSQGLWLRLTRLGPNVVVEQPDITPPVDKYLKGWLKESAPRGCVSVSDLLTLHHLERAPGIPGTLYSIRNQRIIKGFLKRYKRYLRMRLYQKTLEPIYNRLFEWVQQQNENNEELVWGLGHAKLLTPDGLLINGPLLEVLVEVELAPDGGLLIKPRQHTGVALNREVLAALAAADSSAQQSVLSQLHRTVGELESTQLSPGQPTTYVPLLKRIAMETSSGGAFQASSIHAPLSTNNRKRKNTSMFTSSLMVTEAWCLYSRSKPSSVWARDANTLADHIALPERVGDVLPMATWSLTHGPSKLEESLEHQRKSQEASTSEAREKPTNSGGIAGWLSGNFVASVQTDQDAGIANMDEGEKSIIFPLATSDSQHRIADLLLRDNYPAVLAEGPPGTGKTHSIANIVCAYLCQGKRVLVTSKNANALNVLRGRLPKSIQELCVDVTMSELQGMRQLQQTVERLAIRVSTASTDVESEKCRLLQRSIDDLKKQMLEIDQNLTVQSERLRHLLHQPNGVKLMEQSSFLIRTAPWLMISLPEWNVEELEAFHDELAALKLDKNSAILRVSGFESPPPKALVSLALAKSGSTISFLANATRTAVASLPIVGAMMDAQMQRLNDYLAKIKINDKNPETDDEWKVVANALQHALSVHSFQANSWLPNVRERGWPEKSFGDQTTVNDISDLFGNALEVKRLQMSLNAQSEIDSISKIRQMDAYRARLCTQIQYHSEELADAAVVAELSRSFSPDAQSALIRFSQIAGAAKFSKSAKPSKMTQRQRRRRQEYLEAFDRCVRQIPCWIMTSSQISQYLPAETLFDLVVIDESSQSDVTVIPGMMRGKQWLIVGDGKQVSPTEAFVSDDDIENLKASLPSYCPFSDALLPGRSFFDLCAQAFPRGRVVLSEHFRCAPEIIDFSNTQFYDERLIPLRLPTKGERLAPSLIDIKLPNGVKVGKVNEQEADKIVSLVRGVMEKKDFGDSSARSIGIISLLGDDQSRLIRGRLLDAVGPEKIARHDVLIGDPPTFQGAERDIIFLSMVCSPGSSPTQNQQFHFQRANVAMSRARDQCVLVRSIDLKDIPSLDDSKVPIIEFFMRSSHLIENDEARVELSNQWTSDKKRHGASLLQFFLNERGYHLVDMGIVWKNAICVEHEKSDTRAAVMVDCEELSPHEWTMGFAQQKAIERVGWKCLRVDALSLVVNHTSVISDVIQFLTSAGIPDPSLLHNNKNEELDEIGEDVADGSKIYANQENIEIDDGLLMESSDEGDRKLEAAPEVAMRPDNTMSSMDFDQDERIEASKFGEVVGLDFLLRRKPWDGNDENDSGTENGYEDSDDDILEERDLGSVRKDSGNSSRDYFRDRKIPRPSDGTNQGAPHSEAFETTKSVYTDGKKVSRKQNLSVDSPSAEEGVEGVESNSTDSKPQARRRKRRRIDNYTRDGRWYPAHVAKTSEQDDEWYDTDSDLAKEIPNSVPEDDESWQAGENDHSVQSEDIEGELLQVNSKKRMEEVMEDETLQE
ncbi:DNA helicase [Nitzschia inconspicua]|uniref:DNA helicase n=1 Tax=Nitzschia inconspicua TaxID=303405 RepID=A0A9K3M3J4_9STRA|nr:DNA helicase [Nitzschia inconspicua]